MITIVLLVVATLSQSMPINDTEVVITTLASSTLTTPIAFNLSQYSNMSSKEVINEIHIHNNSKIERTKLVLNETHTDTFIKTTSSSMTMTLMIILLVVVAIIVVIIVAALFVMKRRFSKWRLTIGSNAGETNEANNLSTVDNDTKDVNLVKKTSTDNDSNVDTLTKSNENPQEVPNGNLDATRVIDTNGENAKLLPKIDETQQQQQNANGESVQLLEPQDENKLQD